MHTAQECRQNARQSKPQIQISKKPPSTWFGHGQAATRLEVGSVDRRDPRKIKNNRPLQFAAASLWQALVQARIRTRTCPCAANLKAGRVTMLSMNPRCATFIEVAASASR